MFSRPGNLLRRSQDITTACLRRNPGITPLRGRLCSVVQWPQGIPSVTKRDNTGIEPCVSKAASYLWRPTGTIYDLFSLMFGVCALNNHANNEWQCCCQVLPPSMAASCSFDLSCVPMDGVRVKWQQTEVCNSGQPGISLILFLGAGSGNTVVGPDSWPACSDLWVCRQW